MADRWYIIEEGRQKGPYSREELRRRVGSGALNPADPVCSEAMSEWKTAAAVEGLFAAADSDPGMRAGMPPLPGQAQPPPPPGITPGLRGEVPPPPEAMQPVSGESHAPPPPPADSLPPSPPQPGAGLPSPPPAGKKPGPPPPPDSALRQDIYRAVVPPPPPGAKQKSAPASKSRGRGRGSYKLYVLAALLILFSLGAVYYLTSRDDTGSAAGEPVDFLLRVSDPAPEEAGQGEDDYLSAPDEDEEAVDPEEDEFEENAGEQVLPEPGPEPDPDPVETAPLPQPVEEAGGETLPAEGSIAWEGGTYSGPLEDGLPHGHGTWIHGSGRMYTGDFIFGSMTGYGAMVFPGGELYTGFLKNGKAHGQGTMTHPDGRRISGIWVDGNYQED